MKQRTLDMLLNFTMPLSIIIQNKLCLKILILKLTKKIVLVCLVNGSWKIYFLKILLGEVALKEGSLKIRKELEFSYFDQLEMT